MSFLTLDHINIEIISRSIRIVSSDSIKNIICDALTSLLYITMILNIVLSFLVSTVSFIFYIFI